MPERGFLTYESTAIKGIEPQNLIASASFRLIPLTREETFRPGTVAQACNPSTLGG